MQVFICVRVVFEICAKYVVNMNNMIRFRSIVDIIIINYNNITATMLLYLSDVIVCIMGPGETDLVRFLLNDTLVYFVPMPLAIGTTTDPHLGMGQMLLNCHDICYNVKGNETFTNKYWW